MIIGIPRELKKDEYRVGMTPGGVASMRQGGHQVLLEACAGVGSGLTDEEYAEQGATIVSSPEEVWAAAEMVVKVKEPQSAEIPLIRPGQVVFTYFHFASSRELTEAMLRTRAVAIAYETITDAEGGLPLLAPMSEVAGRLSVQEGAKYLEGPMGGRGVLLGGVPGAEPATVLILGGGSVGTHAAKMAAGLGARVILMDISLDRLRYLADVLPANVQTVFSEPAAIRRYLREADLVIGAVLIPGAKAPVLVRRADLSLMKPGSVIVDVGVDQGGCFETSRPTTHSDPIYVVDGVVHYGVANIPGAVARTSTFALTQATLPYACRLADLGYRQAARVDPGVAGGINMQDGRLTNGAVAEAFGMNCQTLQLD